MQTMPEETHSDKRVQEALEQLMREARGKALQDPRRLDEAVRAAALRLGELVTAVVAEETLQERRSTQDWDACGACGGKLRFRQNRWATVRTVLTGRPTKYWSPYLQCTECRRGAAAVDSLLGLDADGFTAALREMAVYAGALEPFEHAAGRLLPRLAGVEISGSKVHTLCQDAGSVGWTVMSEGELGQIDPIKPGERLYVEIDGGMCWIEDGWHEVKLAIIFPERAIADISKGRCEVTERLVVATRGNSEELGALLLNALGRILPQDADGSPVIDSNLLVLGDGAEWIRGIVQEFLPGARQVLDWFHVAEYLAAAAKATYETPQRQRAWRTAQRNLLMAGRVDHVLRGVSQLIMRHSANSEAVEKLRDLHRYLDNRRALLVYHDLLRESACLGSGAVESAVGHVMQQRMKRSGMRWTARGADSMLALRSALRSTGGLDALFSAMERAA